MFSAIWGFALVAGLMTITPGIDTALVLRVASLQGRRQAFASAFGIMTGVFFWGVAAAVGLSALLAASELGYTALRLMGAAYMVWLGVGMFRRALRRGDESGEADAPVQGLFRCWAQGALTNILNPKVGAFYLALLPQFVPAGESSLLMGLVLALVHNVEAVLWFTGLIMGVHQARGWLTRPAVGRVIDRITASVLVGFGIKLALTPR